MHTQNKERKVVAIKLLQKIKDYVLNDLRERYTLKLNVSVWEEGEEYLWFDIDHTLDSLSVGVYCENEGKIGVHFLSEGLEESECRRNTQDHSEKYHLTLIISRINYWCDFLFKIENL